MNRTSRRTSRDNSGQDVLLSSCPGTKIFPCPAISFSRDKGRYKNPGTTPLSQDIPGQNYFPQKQKTAKGCSKTGKGHSKTEKDVLKQEIKGKKWLLIVSSCVPCQILTGCPGLSHPKTRFWACPVVHLSQDNEGTYFCPFASQSCTVLSCWKPHLQPYEK